VTNRLRSDAGRSHFQAKPISWSMRARGSVARIQTKMKMSVNVFSRNQTRSATGGSIAQAQKPMAAVESAPKIRKPARSACQALMRALIA
jgi:hypothetical protein